MKKINKEEKNLEFDNNDNQDLYKFFELLFKVDVRNNPHLYNNHKRDDNE